jgi:hypothetical protein
MTFELNQEALARQTALRKHQDLKGHTAVDRNTGRSFEIVAVTYVGLVDGPLEPVSSWCVDVRLRREGVVNSVSLAEFETGFDFSVAEN